MIAVLAVVVGVIASVGADVLAALWAALNSPLGVTVVAGIVLWALNRLYAAKPMWAQYEGAIISAVRFAEQQIADDTPNQGLRKLDIALRYVLRTFEEVNQRRATPQETAALKEGIQLVHNELEADGALTKAGD